VCAPQLPTAVVVALSTRGMKRSPVRINTPPEILLGENVRLVLFTVYIGLVIVILVDNKLTVQSGHLP